MNAEGLIFIYLKYQMGDEHAREIKGTGNKFILPLGKSLHWKFEVLLGH